MSNAVAEESTARTFATPNEQGSFDAADHEVIREPKGHAEIRVVQRGAQEWARGWSVEMPDRKDGAPPIACGDVFPARGEAIADACEHIIFLCSEEKVAVGPDGAPKGGRKHQRSVQSVQDWALELERRELASAVPVDACDTGTPDDAIPAATVDAIRDVLRAPDPDLCPKCCATMIPLEDGTRAGLLVCVGCDKEEVDAHFAEIQALPPVLLEKVERLEAGVTAAPQLVALTDLFDSPWNPRKIMEGIEELAESVKKAAAPAKKATKGAKGKGKK